MSLKVRFFASKMIFEADFGNLGHFCTYFLRQNLFKELDLDTTMLAKFCKKIRTPSL